MSRQHIVVLIAFLILVILHVIGLVAISDIGGYEPTPPPDPVGVWQGRPAEADNWCIALCLGVNVSPPLPDGSDSPYPELTATQNDVIAMEALFKAWHFDDVIAWKDVDGPVDCGDVRQAIRDAGTVLKEQDLFVIFYSGHGGTVELLLQEDEDEDEQEQDDEENEEEESSTEFVPTWCLSDQQLDYREISELLTDSLGSTRVVVLSDSCYAGAQFLLNRDFEKPPEPDRLAVLDKVWAGFIGDQRGSAVRSLSPRRILETHWAAAQQGRPARRGPLDGRIPISVKLPGGAADGVKEVNRIIITSSEEDEKGQELTDAFGLFTNALVSVWDNGAYTGAYYPEFPKDVDDTVEDRIDNYNENWGTDFEDQTVSTAYRPSETSPFSKQKPFTCKEPDDPES